MARVVQRNILKILFSVLVFFAIDPVMAKEADGAVRQYLFCRADLQKVKEALARKDKRFLSAAEKLRSEAEEALDKGPWTVVDKKSVPPSGNKHDYMSVAKYWWPDPDNPDGPYIRRDGVTNPNTITSDKQELKEMTRTVETLALAYFLFDREAYAEKAAEIIRTWFLDQDTYMSPNLEYGQAIPGRSTGRPFGIIETRRFIQILDAVRILRASKFWSERDQQDLKAWFGAYLDWLLKSDLGRQEARNGNNHETAYCLQVMIYALFTGQKQIALNEIERHFKKRIIYQIEPDGRQPRELSRTKSLHYSLMNLSIMLYICDLARRLGHDLYHFRTSDGRSVWQALTFLYPYVSGQKKWPYQQIEKGKPDYDELFHILRIGALRYDQPEFEATLRKIYGSGYSNHRGQLYWPRFR